MTRLFERHLGVVSLGSFVAFLTVWETVTRAGWIEPLFLPAPSRVLQRAIVMYQDENLVVHVLDSARRVLVGFAIAAAAAVPLGILLGSSRILRAAVDPLLSIIRPLPSMSWIPLSLLWLGIAESQKYSIVFMGSFAPSVLYVMEATRNIDPLFVRAARNLGAGRTAVLYKVILPGALPNILAGLKVMVGIAWTTVISAELVAAKTGLGFLIMNGKEYFLTEQVLLGMALISATVVCIDRTFTWIERRLIPWRVEAAR